MIICISGLEGAGKSTVAKLLAKQLNYRYISIGSIQRELAKNLKVSLEELQKIEKNNKAYDKTIEDIQNTIIQKHENTVLDSRLCAMFNVDFKIFLGAEENIRINRLKKSHHEPSFLTRTINNIERFKKYYNFNYNNKQKYDLVIDTSFIKPKEIIDIILHYLKFLKNKAYIKDI